MMLPLNCYIPHPRYVTQGLEDIHHHTCHCDDATITVVQALDEAQRRGLYWLNFTAHVRASTPHQHVQKFVDDVNTAAVDYPAIAVSVSLETKILDTRGNLDLPSWYSPGSDVNFLLIADHQVTTPAGPTTPKETVALVRSGEETESSVTEWIVDGMCAAMVNYPQNVLAHPLSVFPKIGVGADSLSADIFDRISRTAVETGTAIDVNSKWCAPGQRLISCCIRDGVPVLSGTDTHHTEQPLDLYLPAGGETGAV